MYNENTKRIEKPRKRVIRYMKPGEESWFNYSDWETKDQRGTVPNTGLYASWA